MASTRPIEYQTSDGTARHAESEDGDSWTAPSLPGLEFPGCTPRRLRRSEISTYEGRLEYWDALVETAWVCEPTTPYHEEPSATLSASLRMIAAVRGSPIKCYGTMDLMLRDAGGAPRSIMQADQSVYVRPLRATLPGDAAMVIGEHDFPDVVLEVDHTTDARRGKLKLYEAWGFPEVWIQVPDRPSPSRPRSRIAGLTIHVLADGAYRVSQESRAFPGWTAVEIQTALDEITPSAATAKVLERVGLALGAREGTGPDDDPMLRSQRRRATAHGLRQGREQGLRQGVERGLAEQRALLRRMAERKFGAAVAEALASRLADIDDPARLAEVGEHVIDCTTGTTLLDQIDST